MAPENWLHNPETEKSYNPKEQINSLKMEVEKSLEKEEITNKTKKELTKLFSLQDTLSDRSFRDFIEESMEIGGTIMWMETQKISKFLDYFTIEYINYLKQRDGLTDLYYIHKKLVKNKKFILLISKNELENILKNTFKNLTKEEFNFSVVFNIVENKSIKQVWVRITNNWEEKEETNIQKPKRIENFKWKTFTVKHEYKKENLSEIEMQDKKDNFSNFLESNGVWWFNRVSPEWRFLRAFRFADKINKYAEQYNIPSIYLFTLVTIESYGDPLSYNSWLDWWCWILHFQPWTAKEMWLKIYSQKNAFKNYDSSNTWISYKSWKWLLKLIKKTWNNYSKLSKYDDRFDIDKCLNAGAAYLKRIYNLNNKISKKFQNSTKHQKFMLILNWFNKWPKNIFKRFETWSHMKNVRDFLKSNNKFDLKLEEWIKLWLSQAKLLQFITWNSMIVKKKTKIQNV
jgi:hypothetical protein